MADLTATDPVAEAVAHLKSHPGVLSAFGGAEHISGVVEAPWPHLRVDLGPGGDLGDLLWATTVEVTLEVYDDPAGTRGKAALRALTLTAALALMELTDRVPTTGQPVISRVRPSGMVAFTPLASGQLRCTLGMLVTIRPAKS